MAFKTNFYLKIFFANNRGAVLTGIVVISSFFLIAIASVLVSPIQKTYDMVPIYQDKMQKKFFALAGWNYFLHLTKNKKILPSEGEMEKDILISENQKGSFSWKILLDSQAKGIYNIKVYGSRERKEGSEIILAKIQWTKGVRILEWKQY